MYMALFFVSLTFYSIFCTGRLLQMVQLNDLGGSCFHGVFWKGKGEGRGGAAQCSLIISRKWEAKINDLFPEGQTTKHSLHEP